MKKNYFVLLLFFAMFHAQADESLVLDDVKVTATRINLIGIADSASQGFVPGQPYR